MSSKAAKQKAISKAIARKVTLAKVAKAAKPRVYKGKGAYVRSAPRGNYASGYGDYNMGDGSSIGSHIGAWLGDKAQTLIKSVTGFGDYVKPGWNVKSNSLLSMGQDPPQVKNGSNGGVVVTHREYLGDIVTGTPGEFVVSSYKIQPGLQGSFPWLSVLAQNFEQYRLQGMIYEFKSTSADSLNSTNTALGEVIMATEYDSKKPNFASKMEMQNHQYAVASRQSSSMLHPIECAHPLSTLDLLYIRQGTPPEDTDTRMYDFGNFQIATVGQQGANVNIGELWVSYQVCFEKMRMQGEGNLVLSSVYKQMGPYCTAAADYFGYIANPVDFLQHPNNNLAVKFSGDTIEFPEEIGNGTFVLVVEWTGTAGTNFTPAISHPAGNGIDLSLDALPWDIQSAGVGVSTTRMMVGQMFYLGTPQVPGTKRELTFAGGTLPVGSTCQILITSVITGFDNASFTQVYQEPEWSALALRPMASRRFGRNLRVGLSEKQAVKAEIERLTRLYKEVEKDEKVDKDIEDTPTISPPKEDLANSEAELRRLIELARAKAKH